MYSKRKDLDLGLDFLFMYPCNTNAIMLAQNDLAAFFNKQQDCEPAHFISLPKGEKKKKEALKNITTIILQLYCSFPLRLLKHSGNYGPKTVLST